MARITPGLPESSVRIPHMTPNELDQEMVRLEEQRLELEKPRPKL